MSRCEGLAGQVCYPVTELVVTRCDKAVPFSVKGMSDRESGFASVAVMREVWGL